MFDLNPAVDHLMLDQDLPDPFDRDAAVRPRTAHFDPVEPADHVRTRRLRHAVGTRLIDLGSALTMDDRSVRRPATR
jgi:hypothetical protein